LKKLKRVTNVLRVFSGLNPYNSFKKNAPEAIRTPDLRIRNPIYTISFLASQTFLSYHIHDFRPI